MAGAHLTLELLRTLHRGGSIPQDVAALTLAHLLDLCAQCRQVFETWAREAAEEGFASKLGSWRSSSGSEFSGQAIGAAAGELAGELLALSSDEREKRLLIEPERFRGPALAALLVEQGRCCLPGRLEEAQSLAGLARTILQHERATLETDALYAQALAMQGNALRALGHLRRADDLLAAARYVLERQGGSNWMAQAELDSFEGSLRRAQLRLREAHALFDRAVTTQAAHGHAIDEARALISLGVVLQGEGELDRGAEVTDRARRILEDEGGGLEVLLCAVHNLAVFRLEAGEFGLANEIMASNQDLYDRCSASPARFRHLSLKGCLAMAIGNPEGAEAVFGEAREGYLRKAMSLDAAYVGKDLASLYAKQRRLPELRKIVEEIVQVFEEEEVYSQADEARKLLEDSAGSGSSSVN